MDVSADVDPGDMGLRPALLLSSRSSGGRAFRDEGPREPAADARVDSDPGRMGEEGGGGLA